MRWALGLLLMVAGCAAPQASQKFVVFFSEWSAALDEPAKGTVAAAANWANTHKTQVLTVSGHADPSGSQQANTDLSATRAQVVADELAAQGVAPDRIAKQAAGPTGFASAAIESRRVEILIANP